ncbi:Zn-dependent hydrolase [Cohnella abietis]|uniref:Zn-dependent hydrolase n=1 Tax=Cohnella abietis TaxID=2507935 RepID=A0A3T1DB40_9BACL|nr:Zn-dependent hydrolase [Cohnella abietis]BBI35332.1 Zn-dependent hydrolase [Cohnella abietis]
MSKGKQLGKPDSNRLSTDIEALSRIVDDTKDGWTRRSFTAKYDQGRSWLEERMREAGLTVRIDEASNLIGTLIGTDPKLPSIMIGSHTDTVNGGGRFDGIIGVLGGIEVVRMLKESDIRLHHTLEVVDFTAEEPSEFGISTIGSRGMVGCLSEEMLERTDPDGRTLREAISSLGGRPEQLKHSSRLAGDVALYLEIHIEQGPVLEQVGATLGVVTGIVGIHRHRVTITGQPNHAGTTPMDMRYDALAGFCEMGLAFERQCRMKYDTEAVGTIGRLRNNPNASNVIPGHVDFDLEIRSLDTEVSQAIYQAFEAEAQRIASERGLTVRLERLSQSDAIQVSDDVKRLLLDACSEVAPVIELPSGAGHDANQLASIAPIGMLFVPSVKGRSHCPEEWTELTHIAAGVEALTRATYAFDAFAGLSEKGE